MLDIKRLSRKTTDINYTYPHCTTQTTLLKSCAHASRARYIHITHTYTHTHTDAHSHIHTHTHACMHAHTHTHTHTPIKKDIRSIILQLEKHYPTENSQCKVQHQLYGNESIIYTSTIAHLLYIHACS